MSVSHGVKILKRKQFLWPSGVSSEPQNPAALTDSFTSIHPAARAPASDSRVQQRLVSAKRNVCELRLQLNQLRQLQVLNSAHYLQLMQHK